jgi:hypothetical protein
MRADAAALAVVQIRLKKALGNLGNAAFRAEDVTDTALDAFLVIPDGTLSPPAARFIRTGAARSKNDASGVHFMPGFRPFLLSHENTSMVYFDILTLS